MNTITLLERKLGELYKKVPALPLPARRWLATNSWWIVLVLAILSAIVVLANLPRTFALANVATYSYVYAYNSTPAMAIITASIVTIVLSAVSTVLLFMAVSPLRELRLNGWRLLFANELIGVLSLVAGFVITISAFDVLGLVWGLILAAVELYLLFSIRPEFAGRAANAKEARVIAKRPRKTHA